MKNNKYFIYTKSKIKNNNKGFTLVEMLIAFSILVLLSMTFLPVFSFVAKANVNNKDRLVASNLASSILEEIRALKYDDVGIIAGNPKGLVPGQQKKTINGVEYTINSYINWTSATGKNDKLNQIAYKRVRVTVSAVNIFSGNIEILDEINSIVSREGEEPIYKAGGISVIVKNVNNEPYTKEQFTINITNEPNPVIENNNYTVSTEDGEVYFGIIPAGNYKVKVKIPDKVTAMHGEVIEDGWVVRKNVNVVDWQTTQVVVYMDIEENLCDINLNMIDVKTDNIINEGGLVTLLWTIEGQNITILDKKEFSSSDLEDLVTDDYTHVSSLKSDFFGKLSPIGNYNIVIENVPEYRAFDMSSKGIIKTLEETNVFTEWNGIFSGAGQKIYASAYLKPIYYYYSFDSITLDYNDSVAENILDSSSYSLYAKIPWSNSAENAFDDDLDTSWTITRTGNNKEESVCIDLGDGNAVKIGKVKITFTTDYKFHFTLYGGYLSDNINSEIFNQKNIDSQNGVYEIELMPTIIPNSYRFYRIEIKLTQNNNNSVVDIIEFDLYKYAALSYEGSKEVLNGPLSLDKYSPAPSFTINWDVYVPNKTSYEVYTGITTSSTVQPSRWSKVYSNGQKIPDINVGDDLIGKYLWIKEVFSTTDNSVTPQRNWLNVFYED